MCDGERLYTLGSEPVSTRGTPNPDLYPANNPVLGPPVSGKIGLLSKTDSTSYFEEYACKPEIAFDCWRNAAASSPGQYPQKLT